MATFKITGEVVHESINGGVWGIKGHDGKLWRPTKMPDALKQEGKQVALTAEQAKEQFSIFMWGTAIHILSID